jgi:serine/threonine-protein kinase
MFFSPGTSFGPYEILAPIGAGGMGEVYRARDRKLKRDVALKVLPDVFAQEPSRMIRFQREAELLASLNHQNIAHIYGVEERALAMELVEGDSPRGPMGFDEAWKIASQIADALEYAHDKGIVHRDLKPANVKVTSDGVVKLLDFGLAKAFNDLSDAPSNDPSNSPTLSLGATLAGAIIGTAGYMAPEQAKGRPVDKRADIWAWGVLFYELLTGQQLFQGEDVSELLAQVLTKQPDLERVPAKARRVLDACLKKDPKQRLRDIGDAKRLIDDDPPAASTSISIGKRDRGLPWSVATVATVMALALLWTWMHRPQQNPTHVVRFAANVPIANRSPGVIAVSRDGTRLAFVGGPQNQIYVRIMDQMEARPLPGTEDSSALSFSSDGEWISYVSGRASPDSLLKKISIAGGPPQTLAPAPSRSGPPFPTWGDDGNIYFTADGGLSRVPSSGGTTEHLAAPDRKKGEAFFDAPQPLPGGKQVLVNILPEGSGRSRVAAFDLQTGQKKTLLENSGLAMYVATGLPPTGAHLFSWATGSLMAVPFDVKRLEVRGTPVPVLEGVAPALGPFGAFALSESGTLAYVPGPFSGSSARTMVWVNRQGIEEATSCEPRQYNLPRLSPDGERIVVEIQNPDRREADVWICDVTRGTLSRVTSDKTNTKPFWLPGGNRVSYSGFSPGEGSHVVLAPLDGGSPTVLRTEAFSADSGSPDGKFLIGTTDGSGGRTITVLPIDESPASNSNTRSMNFNFRGVDVQFSPDGKWVAYQSRETGRLEIYVQAYPGPGGKTIISSDGGAQPRWSHNGELFYKNGNKLMAVEVQTSPKFSASKPKLLFEQPSYANGYDVAPDGTRFLMIKSNDEQPVKADQLNFVLNWFEELRRRLPAKE